MRVVPVVADHGVDEGEGEDNDGPCAGTDAGRRVTNLARSLKRNGKSSTLRGSGKGSYGANGE